MQIRHDPKNLRLFFHWKHCSCSDKDKEKCFSERGLSEISREEGGGGDFQLSNENKASKVSMLGFEHGHLSWKNFFFIFTAKENLSSKTC